MHDVSSPSFVASIPRQAVTFGTVRRPKGALPYSHLPPHAGIACQPRTHVLTFRRSTTAHPPSQPPATAALEPTGEAERAIADGRFIQARQMLRTVATDSSQMVEPVGAART